MTKMSACRQWWLGGVTVNTRFATFVSPVRIPVMILLGCFGWGKSGKVTAAGWQVTLCDPRWHVISRSGEVISTNCYIPCTLLTYFTVFSNYCVCVKFIFPICVDWISELRLNPVWKACCLGSNHCWYGCVFPSISDLDVIAINCLPIK